MGLVAGPDAAELATAGLMAVHSRWSLPLNPEDYDLIALIALTSASSEASLQDIYDWGQRVIDANIPTHFFIAGDILQNLADPQRRSDRRLSSCRRLHARRRCGT